MMITDAQKGRHTMPVSTRLWAGRDCILQTSPAYADSITAVTANIHASGRGGAGEFRTETFAKPYHFQRKRLT